MLATAFRPTATATAADADRTVGRFIYAWVAARTAIWVAIAALTVANAPLDTVEWLAWGNEWQLGYAKHPPFPAWLGQAFVVAAGGVWGAYLASYLCIAACFLAAWHVGRDLLPPRLAAAGVLCLEGLFYFTHDGAEFSNNVVLDACWAGVVLCFHKATRTGRLTWWLALGGVGGAGLLTKYTIAVLFAVLAAWLLGSRDARRHLARPGPYVAAAIALLVFAPHAVWMVNHEFITLKYGLERSLDPGSWVRHVKNPVGFVGSQFARMLPLLWIVVPLVWYAWQWRRAAGPGAGFLAVVVLGPVALILGGAAVSGSQVREIWGSPLWTFAGLLLVAGLRGNPDGWASAIRRARLVAVAMLAFSVGKQYVEPFHTKVGGRTQFPGRALAADVERLWMAEYATPFRVVGGEPWLAGNVSLYAPHRPTMYSSGATGYLNMDEAACPWTGDADISTRGGVLVWDADRDGEDVPAYFRVKFPSVVGKGTRVLPMQSLAEVPPARVGVAFVPPGR